MGVATNKAKEMAAERWEGVKERVVIAGKATGGFFIRNWKPILAISLAAILILLAYRKGQQDGSASADTAWITKYNETVKEFNDRIRSLQGSSSEVAETVEKGNKGLTSDLDKEEQRIKNLADRQADQKAGRDPNAVGTQCPNVIDLNGELPPEFWEAWNRMNNAGANNNPYK